MLLLLLPGANTRCEGTGRAKVESRMGRQCRVVSRGRGPRAVVELEGAVTKTIVCTVLHVNNGS